jgi:hypothetical protein
MCDVLDKATLGMVSIEHFGFPLPITIQVKLHTHLLSRAGAVCPFEAAEPMY